MNGLVKAVLVGVISGLIVQAILNAAQQNLPKVQ